MVQKTYFLETFLIEANNLQTIKKINNEENQIVVFPTKMWILKIISEIHSI